MSRTPELSTSLPNTRIGAAALPGAQRMIEACEPEKWIRALEERHGANGETDGLWPV